MRIASQQPISYDVNRAVRSAKRWRKVARKSRVAWCTRRPSASNFSCTRPTTTSGCRSAYVFVNTNAWRNCDWPRAVAGHPWRGPHHSGHFPVQSASSRRDLRQLFRRGRISLAIGLAFLASAIAIGDALASYFQESRWAAILRESLVIGGWVAMWRPLEVFLYDWWPIREEARLFDRLSAMPVRIVYEAETSPDAWRSDWPAVPAADQSSTARAQARSHARDTIGQGVIHDTTRDEAASAHSRRGTKDPGSRS
jgi:hypothetical protein